MITIPQNVMRLGLIATFAVGGIVAERLVIFAYKLAKPAVKRLYDKVTGDIVVPHVPVRSKPAIVAKPANGKRGPKAVPTAPAPAVAVAE